MQTRSHASRCTVLTPCATDADALPTAAIADADRGSRPPASATRRCAHVGFGRSEERLLETKGQLAKAVGQNEKLSYTLREAREHIATLRDEVDKLSQPPSAYGVVVGKNDDGTIDVLTSGRKMRVTLHPDIDHEMLDRGAEVVLNESLNVVIARAAGRDR